jgi:hypothetical protein
MNIRTRIAALAVTGLIAVAASVGLGVGAASAATASDCNAYAATLAGQGMECTVTVDNYIDGVAEYSTVTIKECHGAAYTVLLATECTTTVIIDDELTDSVSQCNGTLNGGGSNVTCAVIVNNHFSGSPTPAIATLNQCIGSGAGGTSPTGTPLNCAPPGSTSGATVTQCNGSVNGGGAPLRVNCDLPAGTQTALPLTIDQCNGTVNGGGSVLFCHTQITDTYNIDFATAGLPSSPTAGPPTTTTPPTTTGGTFGTPGGPNFQPPAVGGVTVTPADGSSGPLLALSGSNSWIPALWAISLIALGAIGVGLGRRRIRHPMHRMG